MPFQAPSSHDDYCDGLDPTVCHNAYKLASRVVRDMESYSQVINPLREQAIPKFERDEVVLGGLLGSGGFNNVFAVHEIDLHHNATHVNTEQEARRISFANQANTGGRYAVKLLKREVMQNKEDYCNGAADLMIETKILANIKPHRNIIQLHGMSASGAAGFAEGVEGGYFIIVDRLQGTLTKRIRTWREMNTPLSERLPVAFELASALKHLHSYNIIFRDLKPDNVGFDVDGTLKLFDFGLAKELKPAERNADDTYEMSGQTGSRRYMAPEVALSKPYNMNADVYGFGIVFWQICSLQEPFEGMSIVDHMNSVVMGFERPRLNSEWPVKIGNIMKWSWADDQYVRPPMKEVHRALKQVIKLSRTQTGAIKLELQKIESMSVLGGLPTKSVDAVGHSSMIGLDALRNHTNNVKSSLFPVSQDTEAIRKAPILRSMLSTVPKTRKPLVSVLSDAVALANSGEQWLQPPIDR
mmetsp:Transcript_8581/g.12255  ORF Transcript_8581/g.12255 Transcript_8581/m.12255 type:complete len:470 (+) Transcript_8581:13-1422(+)